MSQNRKNVLYLTFDRTENVKLFLIIGISIWGQMLSAAIYYTAQDGDITNPLTWAEGNIPRIPNLADTSNDVYIMHSVTNPVSGQSQIKCYMEVTMSGSFYTNQQFHINGPKAHIVVWGYLNVHNNLYMENGGLLQVFYGGYVFVDNKVDNSGGGTINLHGGTICWHNLWKGAQPTGVGVTLHGSCYGSLGPLGITLISFETVYQSGITEISWVTENESNNAYFTVERSLDLVSWEVVTRVEGSLYSSGVKSYHEHDPAPLPGFNYYRLSQTDVDGTTTLFDGLWLRYIDCDREGKNLLFPNPATESVNIWNAESSVTKYYIYGNQGQFLSHGVLLQGINDLKVDGLAPGMYVITTSAGDRFQFIKQ